MSVARGILTGFLKEGLEQKAARDEMYADLAVQAGIDVKENINLFRKEEDKRQERFNLLEKELGTPAALYASYEDLTASDAGMDLMRNAPKDFLDKLKDVDFQGYGYNTAKSQRFMNFSEQQKKVFKNLGDNQFPVPVAELAFKDLESMNTGSQSMDTDAQVARPELDLPNMSEFSRETGSSFSAKPQFRLRLNDTTQAAFSNVGLDGQFYMKGDNLVTQFDEASRNKGILTQELINNRFTPEVAQNAGYLNVATKVANEVKGLEASTSKFKTDTDILFENNNYSSGSIGAKNDKTYEQFIIANQGILSAYGKGSIAYKRFIREKFNALTPSDQGYYSFFERFDKEVDAEDI
tara:strand:+ start:40 stop:1095 length:1056 start_codon:yes stop_codon:yes gene_type:complete